MDDLSVIDGQRDIANKIESITMQYPGTIKW